MAKKTVKEKYYEAVLKKAHTIGLGTSGQQTFPKGYVIQTGMKLEDIKFRKTEGFMLPVLWTNAKIKYKDVNIFEVTKMYVETRKKYNG